MDDDVMENISYNSPEMRVGESLKFSPNGLHCNFKSEWSYDDFVEVTLTIDSSDPRFDHSKISGTVFVIEEFPVELTERVHIFKKEIYIKKGDSFYFAVKLNKKLDYELLFLPSDLNDTVLVVDGKKLHVNTHFLSYHSDFFKTLFSGSFKEGGMDEIPIEDVSFDDFALLMSFIYPKSHTFPTDENVEKLLEMADRFMFPGVISRVEYHLTHNSAIDLAGMILMADKYRMCILLEDCISQLTSAAAVRNLKAAKEYKELSSNTKAEILDRAKF